MGKQSNKLKPEIDIELNPKQWEALSSKATEILYGGAAGGGKSFALRAAAVLWCVKIPGLQVYLFRRHYGELIQNHMEGPGSFPELLAGYEAHGLVKIVKRQIKFRNGSRIFLANAERDREVYRYRGYEIHVLLLDELTTLSEVMYRFLRSRVRMSKEIKLPKEYAAKEDGGDNEWPLFPRILAGSNPGDIGHAFVKRLFITPRKPGEISELQSDGGGRCQFIPSRLKDNKHIDPKEYEAKLEGLGDPVLVRAMLDGDWSVAVGAMFGEVWRAREHICQAFPIPIDWQIWRGADDGYASPASVCWLTQDPNTKRYYVIDELHKAGMLPEEFAERVKSRDMSIPVIGWDGAVTTNKLPLSGLLDSAAFADTGQGKISRGKQLNALGCNWSPVEKWPGSRKHRAQNLHKLLANMPDGRPGIRIFAHCYNLIETLPTLPRDRRDPECVDTDGDDHCFDSLTYGLQWRDLRPSKTRIGGF